MRLDQIKELTEILKTEELHSQRQVQERRGYLHKCAVCGVTDTDKPDMEFRYCSGDYQCNA